ncbi:hypothetical protein CCACVL1_10442 [Corchorus capsularis]|uniref:Uncharacterized protein n=1 Tax=Corchorus capsularis TaxID=210143 RepID=A0A1R3IR64_COCAP|nr:hypothetical protein CCACVL1_10442 [Corchorus capsularis]
MGDSEKQIKEVKRSESLFRHGWKAIGLCKKGWYVVRMKVIKGGNRGIHDKKAG